MLRRHAISPDDSLVARAPPLQVNLLGLFIRIFGVRKGVITGAQHVTEGVKVNHKYR
jgi:hypothetical protein